MITRISMTLTATALITMAAPTQEQMRALVGNRPELDEIRWKDPARGAPLKVRIIQSTAQAITVEKTLPAGLVVRVIPLGDLGGVSFTFTSRESELHRQPSAAAAAPLRVYWETRQATLRLPGSNAGETGLALARSLRLAGDSAALDEAGKILDQIRSQDPGTNRVDRAKAEQTTLDFIRSVQRGKPAETDTLAWAITEEPDNADAMLLATAFLAERHFAELRATDEAHPRWVDDDEVRPLRERLYHLSLDFSLYPSLFLGTRVEEASAGLKVAAAVHQFTGANLLAKNTLEDLAVLYPDSEAAKETAPLLASLKALDAAGKLSPDPVGTDEEVSDESAEITPTGPPPPPKHYNIFGD
jgi:hypothetical protein